jgi:hypothetical protein
MSVFSPAKASDIETLRQIETSRLLHACKEAFVPNMASFATKSLRGFPEAHQAPFLKRLEDVLSEDLQSKVDSLVRSILHISLIGKSEAQIREKAAELQAKEITPLTWDPAWVQIVFRSESDALKSFHSFVESSVLKTKADLLEATFYETVVKYFTEPEAFLARLDIRDGQFFPK